MAVALGPGGKSSSGTVVLSWEAVTLGADGSPEPDPVEYRIYYDTAADFAPVPANLLRSTAQLSYTHSDARIGDPQANLFYLVTAVDVSGNESAPSNRVGEFDRHCRASAGK
jgi:hypothetical protein